MKQIRSGIAMLCAVLMSAPPTYAQSGSGTNPRAPQLDTGSTHWYSGITRDFEARPVAPVNVSNSPRVDALLRAGQLYLSLSDAIALAVENNLDVEIERYEFALADTEVLRAKAGASTVGIPTTVLPGISTGAGALLGNVAVGLPALGYVSPLGPNGTFDPLLIGNLNFGHATAPQSNTVTSGTPALVTANKTANFGISQTYGTGGTAALSFNNNTTEQNSFRSTVNPATASSLDLTVTQPLLQGFGLAVNRRTIRIAKNNVKAADYVFRQQLINTVANVVQLYWNLVASTAQVGVQEQAIGVAQKLYDDNKKQVDVGTLAPIEIIRAEAQLATAQQGLVAAQSQAAQLEIVLKSAISRNGLASPSVSEAHVVPTDPIRIPDVEPIQPIQDLVSMALDNRPDLAQSRVQIENYKIALTGTKNQLLPLLSAVGDFRSNALAGPQNTVIGPVSPATGLLQSPAIADPFFVGGYGSVLSQLFGRNFPTYSAGLNLTIPLGNRAAQANIATATLNLRINELQVQRQINQIRVDVQNALTALQLARAVYQAAVKGRILEEQTLDADQKKLALGATTVYQVIQDQRDLTTAAGAEVGAENAYMAARTQLDLAVGLTLQNNSVEFDEAKSGRVSRAPNPLPVPLPAQGSITPAVPVNGAKSSLVLPAVAR
jgi:outer membrane protein